MLKSKWEALALADVPHRIAEYYRLNELPQQFKDKPEDKDWWAENLLISTDKLFILITFKYVVHRWNKAYVVGKILDQWTLEREEQRNDRYKGEGP